MKKILIFLLAFACLICTPAYAQGTPEEALKQEILDYMVLANQIAGMQMTQKQIEELDSIVYFTAQKYVDIENISEEAAYKLLLAELKKTTPLESKPAVHATTLTPLPSGEKGAIFFTDNDKVWNHVGLYTSVTEIVESMPKPGVQFLPISDSRTYQAVVQNPADGVNDSCILVVNTSMANVNKAVDWAFTVPAGTPYDYDFLDNKTDYYAVMEGGIAVTKSENDAFNCSELVWKSYKKGANIDLDSDGGPGVYPDDIKNSTLTIKLRSFG